MHKKDVLDEDEISNIIKCYHESQQLTEEQMKPKRKKLKIYIIGNILDDQFKFTLTNVKSANLPNI